MYMYNYNHNVLYPNIIYSINLLGKCPMAKSNIYIQEMSKQCSINGPSKCHS